MTAPAPATGRTAPVRAAVALSLLLAAAAARADAGGEYAPPAAAREAVAVMRARFGAGAEGVADDWRALTYLGRPGAEVKGRAAGGDGATHVRDWGIVDLPTGRIAAFAWFPNASRRRAGEAILPISQISVAADQRLREVFPGAQLALESIQRYRASGEESVYYEVRYAPQEGEVRFLHPPVRLLLDASTGNLFRVDADPDWPDLARVSTKGLLSRRAAERIAAVGLRAADLTELGAAAPAGRIEAVDLLVVRPNGWLGFPPADPAARARIAWAVAFGVPGAGGAARHTLFVDASSGRILGGQPGPPP